MHRKESPVTDMGCYTVHQFHAKKTLTHRPANSVIDFLIKASLTQHVMCLQYVYYYNFGTWKQQWCSQITPSLSINYDQI